MQVYTIVIGGIEHTIQLSDEEAKARGLFKEKPATPAKQAPAPANKAREASNKKG